MSDRTPLRTILKDELILVSRGSYSDYQVVCIARALKDIPMEQIFTDWFTARPEQWKANQFKDDHFMQYLFSYGFLEEQLFTELYLSTTASEVIIEDKELKEN